MDPLDQPLADLIGHSLDVTTRCACTKVTAFSPEQLIRMLGDGATLRSAQARLICKDCRTRPALMVGRTWATHPSRDTRRDPSPLPAWVVPLIED